MSESLLKPLAFGAKCVYVFIALASTCISSFSGCVHVKAKLARERGTSA